MSIPLPRLLGFLAHQVAAASRSWGMAAQFIQQLSSSPSTMPLHQAGIKKSSRTLTSAWPSSHSAPDRHEPGVKGRILVSRRADTMYCLWWIIAVIVSRSCALDSGICPNWITLHMGFACWAKASYQIAICIVILKCLPVWWSINIHILCLYFVGGRLWTHGPPLFPGVEKCLGVKR